ncbi:hypothetical protein C8Q77DRAFT_1159751 [Trametes polyzona]|nr:hypothetical protein C8Q77DRAFT_1159751 [Trametes polyzona]
MSTSSRAGPNGTHPRAPSSALGFLSRGIQSVSSFVSNISTMFSSSAPEIAPPTVSEDGEASATQSSHVEDDEQAHTGSSATEDGLDNSALASDIPSTSEDDSQTRSSSPVGRRDIAPAPASTLAHGTPSAAGPAPSTSAQPPRRRGVLRREPVWIHGQDPSTVTPASELRGRDPRTIRENRYWLPDRWGPLPTLRDIQSGTRIPSARAVILYLQRRYGERTEPFWQAVDFLFPLPDGTDYRPRFERILRTSAWRDQSDDWIGGIEPVERVREPARADDAADSEAEVESVGYISDDGPSTPHSAPSSHPTASSSSSPAPPSPSSVPAPALSSSGSPPLALTSPGAGPSRPARQRRKRSRDPERDAEDSTTSSQEDSVRPATRRRLTLTPPPAPSSPAPSASAPSGSGRVARARRAPRERPHASSSSRRASLRPRPAPSPAQSAPDADARPESPSAADLEDAARAGPSSAPSRSPTQCLPPPQASPAPAEGSEGRERRTLRKRRRDGAGTEVDGAPEGSEGSGKKRRRRR